MKNAIDQIRPKSTFENYIPITDEQKVAKDLLINISNQLIQNEASFSKQPQSPFPKANLINLFGTTGTGKTHLIESLLNHLKTNSETIFKNCYLFRDNFTTSHICYIPVYDQKQIIIIDDLYSTHQNINNLDHVDIRVFSDWIANIYERRTLVITTSNFSILGTSGIAKKIEEQDTIGRTTSRLIELLARAKEIYVKGPDHRRTTPKNTEFKLF